jgi:GT2 family glycosyltransferase
MNKAEASRSTISIVSATYNCADQLSNLIDSLRCQTDKDFEWVVSDGASSDGTLQLLQAITDLDVVIISQPDFGIYDALNRALRATTGQYYIVAGADDCFAADAIANYRRTMEDQSHPDILAARVLYGSSSFEIKRGPSWLFGEKSFIANHSVGTAFRKELHDRFGFYSNKFPIAADSLFVIQACKGGATRCELDFVAGEIGTQGVSAVDWAGSATELFRVQLIAGSSVLVQTFLLLLRIIKGANSRVQVLYASVFRQ